MASPQPVLLRHAPAPEPPCFPGAAHAYASQYALLVPPDVSDLYGTADPVLDVYGLNYLELGNCTQAPYSYCGGKDSDCLARNGCVPLSGQRPRGTGNDALEGLQGVCQLSGDACSVGAGDCAAMNKCVMPTAGEKQSLAIPASLGPAVAGLTTPEEVCRYAFGRGFLPVHSFAADAPLRCAPASGQMLAPHF